MTILTDAVIEKAARAINPWVWDKAPGANPVADGAQMAAIAHARAALEAVLPDIIEACAKAVRGVPFYGGSYDGLTGYPTPEEYVNVIRSLSPKQKD